MDGYKCWKLALRELFHLEYITYNDLLIMYHKTYYDNSDYKTDPMYTGYYLLILDILKNKNLFNNMVKEDIDIITLNILPDNKLAFKKIWISYILDCIEYNTIDVCDYDVYLNKISFNNIAWDESERLSAYDVIDKLRIGILKAKPSAIEYMGYVSFDMLMQLNEMEYKHD